MSKVTRSIIVILVCVVFPAIALGWSFSYTSSGTTNNTTGLGGSGNALAFTTANHIVFTDSGDYLTIGSNEMAISFWYKSSTQESNRGIVQKGNMANDYDWALIKNGSSWIWRCGVPCGGSTDYVISARDDGNWHYISLVFAPTVLRMYIDGVYVAPNTPGTDARSSVAFRTNQDVIFGVYHSGPYRSTFHLDDVAIFNSHITAAEVSTYYNSGASYGFNSNNCLIYFNNFDGGDGGGAAGSCTPPGGSPSTPPSISTLSSTAIMATTVTFEGEVPTNNGSAVTQSGFAYSTNSGLTTGVSTSTLGGQSDEAFFEESKTGLTCNTTYYYRAYGTNAGGTSYGSIVSFNTGVCVPSIYFPTPDPITATTSGFFGEAASNGFALTQTGFAYGTSANLSTVIATSTVENDGAEYRETISGLTCGTTYYARAYAINSIGTAYSSIISFTTSACPELPAISYTEFNVMSPTQIYALILIAQGNFPILQSGYAYGTSSNLSTVVATTTQGPRGGPEMFVEKTFTGLTCETEYYFRGYGENENGIGYSSIIPATTADCGNIADVLSHSFSNISTTSLRLNGLITVTGGENVYQSGFAYGTSPNLSTVIATTTFGAHEENPSAYGTNITELSCNTIYFARAYGTNIAGTGYGAIISTSTLACPSDISTDTPTSVSQSSLTLNGSITATGGAEVSQSGFAYGTSTNLSTVIATSTLGAQVGTASFSESITGLSPETTYYVRAYGINSAGTAYGSIVSVITASTPAPVSGGGGGSSGGGSGYQPPAQEAVPPAFIPTVNPVLPVVPNLVREILSAEVVSETETEEEVETKNIPADLKLFIEKISSLEDFVFDLEKMKTEAVIVPQKTFADVANLPSEIISITASDNGIDFPLSVRLDKNDKVVQEVRTLSNTPLSLSIKPDGPVDGVSGYVTFQKSTHSAHNRSFWGRVAHAQEVEFIVERFEYKDEDGDGVYTSEITTPHTQGEYEVVTLMHYKDPEKGTQERRLITIVDPEGYVFEKNGKSQTRLSDAKITLWKMASGSPMLWDAEKYNQKNPQTTDVTGKYAFLVPPGEYFITAELEGYREFKGEVISVAYGQGIHSNIELRKEYSVLAYLLDWKLLVALASLLVALYIGLKYGLKKD